MCGHPFDYSSWNNLIKLASKKDLEAQNKHEADAKALEEQCTKMRDEIHRRREVNASPTEWRKICVNPDINIDSLVLQPGTKHLGTHSPMEMWRVKVNVSFK
jgi:hypothetical protein